MRVLCPLEGQSSIHVAFALGNSVLLGMRLNFDMPQNVRIISKRAFFLQRAMQCHCLSAIVGTALDML